MSAIGTGFLVTSHLDAKLLFVRSLADGMLLQTFSFPIQDAGFLRLSPNGRYLTCMYTLRNPLVRLADGWHGGLMTRLQDMFPDSDHLLLFDLETGMTCPDLMGDRWSTFTDDSTHLISYTYEGRYEYDVPPRWQYFTSWAWAALGAWLSLIAVWWSLRKGRILCS